MKKEGTPGIRQQRKKGGSRAGLEMSGGVIRGRENKEHGVGIGRGKGEKRRGCGRTSSQGGGTRFVNAW